MYLGIDFLIFSQPKPYVIEVNVGLPGGAQGYDLTRLVHFGRLSDIFHRIEETFSRVYGRSFGNYRSSSPHSQSLKPFRIWEDEKGPFPYEDEVARTTVHLPEPILRTVKDLSVKIERFYEGLDFKALSIGCFEEGCSSPLSSVSVIKTHF